MRTTFKKLFFLSFFFGFAALSSAEPFLRIIQPFENQDLPPVAESFVFGSVLPASATLRINGIPVKPHSNGGFLEMIPFEPGRFEIVAEAFDGVSTTTVVRTINVPEGARAFSDKDNRIRPIAPDGKVVLRAGDTVEFSFQGAPGGKGYFKIAGSGTAYPMMEKEGGTPGIYEGAYTFQPEDSFDSEYVLFVLRRADGKRLTQRAASRLTVQKRRIPRYIKTIQETVLLTGPGRYYGYHMFFPENTQLEVTGEYGEFYRVELDRNRFGWIRQSHAASLPAGAPPAKSVTRNIRVSTTRDSTLLEMPLSHVHPFRVDQQLNPHRLRLTLFGVIPDTDRVRYKSRDSVIREITWTQEDPGSAVFDILTEQKLAWGYDVRYEDTTLVVEIRHAPKLGGWGGPLKGLKVVVDAGHTPKSFGTIGPWGHTEAQVNLLTTMKLKEALEKKGAEVILTQDGNKEISLQERTQVAWSERAHMFISLHCDATGEGRDPREEQGFSIHYYHSQSRPLADAIHSIYEKRSGVRDQGLWQSNLAVSRMTTMPSVLVEQAFLILPEYEELLLTQKFQKLVSDILTSAIEEVVAKAQP